MPRFIFCVGEKEKTKPSKKASLVLGEGSDENGRTATAETELPFRSVHAELATLTDPSGQTRGHHFQTPVRHQCEGL